MSWVHGGGSCRGSPVTGAPIMAACCGLITVHPRGGGVSGAHGRTVYGKSRCMIQTVPNCGSGGGGKNTGWPARK
jgi:hypothetical protein